MAKGTCYETFTLISQYLESKKGFQLESSQLHNLFFILVIGKIYKWQMVRGIM